MSKRQVSRQMKINQFCLQNSSNASKRDPTATAIVQSDNQDAKNVTVTDTDSDISAPIVKRSRTKTKDRRIQSDSDSHLNTSSEDRCHSNVNTDVSASSGEDSSHSNKRHKRKNLKNTKVKAPRKKHGEKRIQKFRKFWSSKYSWAQPSKKGPTYYKCSVCSCTLKCGTSGLTSLKRHEVRRSHKKRANASCEESNLFQMVQKESTVEKAARTLELQAALFIVSKNLPFSIADDFIDFLKKIRVDINIQGKLRCRRTKCRALICHVLAERAKRMLVEELQSGKFSIMIDEATDGSITKHLGVTVRHMGSEPFTVVDEFLALLEVTDATHKGLFRLIETFFTDHSIPYSNNMIGFASDGANVMMGAHHSVSVEFRKRIPNLFIMKCICHSLDLAVSKATKKLPTYLEELLIDIFFYLKYSPKRVNAVAELQNLLEIPKHRILQLHKVRWLSLEAVVNRTLEQYPVLLTYFEKEKSQTNEKATKIYDRLKNPYTKIYLEFLSSILRLVCRRNAEYQSEAPKIYLLHEQMSSLFKTIVSMYLQEDYVEQTDPEFIEYCEKTSTNAHNWEPLLHISIGAVAKADLYALKAELKDKEAFRDTCRNFLIELAKQIFLCFPFNDKNVKFLENIKFIHPAHVKEIRDVTIAAQFLGFDVQEVDDEYKSLRRRFKDNVDQDVKVFWTKVASITYPDGSLEYPQLVDMVSRILLLPHSSAAVERIFSQVGIQKTKVAINSICRQQWSPSEEPLD